MARKETSKAKKKVDEKGATEEPKKKPEKRPPKVRLTKRAEDDFRKAPKQVQRKFSTWALSVEAIGLQEVRKRGGSGLHDEPLKGKLKGRQSVRLSGQWRAFYTEEVEVTEDGEGRKKIVIETIEIVEVYHIGPHDYKK